MEKYKLKELTPDNMKCPPFGGCPSVYEECGPMTGCPTIKEHKEEYLIIGKVEDAKKFGLEKRVGEGEILISVPKGLIDGMKK